MGQKKQQQKSPENKINTKTADVKKSDLEKENLKSISINDSSWQCTVVMVLLQTERLYNELKGLKDLPYFITVVTKEYLDQSSKEGKTRSKSRESSKSRKRSTSKTSKKSNKFKSGNSTSSKKNRDTLSNSNVIEDSGNDVFESSETCLQLKQFIVNLKNSDLKNHNRDSNIYKTQGYINEMKYKDYNKTVLNNEKNNNIETEQDIGVKNMKTHRYVILWGFYYPHMPELLIELDVPVRALINIKESNYEILSPLEVPTVGINDKKKSHKKGNKNSDNFNNDYVNFVSKINEKARLEANKNMLFLTYTNITNNPQENNTNFKLNFLKLLEDIKKAWDNFETYCNTVNIVEVPFDEELKLQNANLYTTLISMVPLESVNIPTVIHCMLEQVAWWNGDTESREEYLLVHDSVVDKQLENITPILIDERDYVRYKTFHLDLPEFDFENICRNMYSKSPIYGLWKNFPSQPLSKFKWYDYQIGRIKSCSKTYYSNSDKLFITHLHQIVMNLLVSKISQLTMLSDNNGVISPLNIEERESIECLEDKICSSKTSLSMLSKMSLKEQISPTTSITEKLCEETVSNQNKKSFPSINSNWNEKRERVTNINESKNKLYREERLEKLKTFLICSDFEYIYKEFLNITVDGTMVDHLRDYEFVQEYNLNTLSQSLQKAFQSFLNVDFLYFAPTDSILLWFNNIGESGTRSSHNIETKLGFQDFYKYKLKGKLNFEETKIQNEPFSRNSLGSNGIGSTETNICQETPQTDYKCHTMYNLGSFYIETSESLKYFFSADSSYVSVKQIKYFLNETSLFVSVHKNYTSLNYELNPQIPKNNITILIRLENNMIVNCNLKWDKIKSMYSSNNLDEEMILNNKNCAISQEKLSTIISKTTSLPDLQSDLITNVLARTSQQSLAPNLLAIDGELSSPSSHISINNEQNLPIPTKSLVTIHTKNPPGEDVSEKEDFKIDSNLTISLPTGLLVEVVPTEGLLGPFYIRQSYLSKGPVCNTVWEELKRCYFNNGTIVIFFLDGTVDIFYSNGTAVKCNEFKLAEPIILQHTEDPVDQEQHSVIREEYKATHQSNKHEIKSQNTNINKSIKGKFKTSIKGKKQSKNIPKPSLLIKEEELPIQLREVEKENHQLYNISQHSVLSWDGEYKEFKDNKLTHIEKRNSKKIAFDHINQELYLLRNDGMSSLFTPENLSVAFPDGTKITSYTEDGERLILGDSLVVNTEPSVILNPDGTKKSYTEDGKSLIVGDSLVVNIEPSIILSPDGTKKSYTEDGKSSIVGDSLVVNTEPSIILNPDGIKKTSYTEDGESLIVRDSLLVKTEPSIILNPDGTKKTSYTEDGKSLIVGDSLPVNTNRSKILNPDGTKITSYTGHGKRLTVRDSLLVNTNRSKILNPDGTKLISNNEDEERLTVQDSLFVETESSVILNSVRIDSERSRTDVFKIGCPNVSESNDFVFVETKYILEHSNYVTVIYYNSCKDVELKFPGNVTFQINKDKLFKINIQGNEAMRLFNNYFTFETVVLDNSFKKSTSTLHFKNVDSSPTIFCETEDSFGNIFSVDGQGTTNLKRSNESDLHQQSRSSCYSLCPENMHRFFVFKRDLTGYEMIHKHKIKDLVDVIQHPVASRNMLRSFYKQSPIHKNISEQYLMNYFNGKLLPKLIKRKDLVNEEPSVTWFFPELSSVTQTDSKENVCLEQMPRAMVIAKMLQIKTNNFDIIDDFEKLFKLYMAQGEGCLDRYMNFYLEPNGDKYDSEVSKELCRDVFGSNSYYLPENLPTVVIKNEISQLSQGKHIDSIMSMLCTSSEMLSNKMY